MQIAKECQKRGYEITVLTTSWDGEIPEGFDIKFLKSKAISNHGKMMEFASFVADEVKKKDYSALVSFNRIPGLDVYFAGDNCIKEKGYAERGVFYRLTPRYKTFAELEKAVFDKDLNTQILYLVERQKKEYQKHYLTQDYRFHLMPAGISIERKRPANDEEIRKAMRSSLGISESAKILIQVGSGFITKGLDRSITALASLSKEIKDITVLLVVGKGNSKNFIQLAKELGIDSNVRLLGGRTDVTNLLVSSDLMIHPAISEATGTVLMEALAAGLPVMCSGVCGYACYIEKAKAGIVIPEPFKQEILNEELNKILSRNDLVQMSKNALVYTYTHQEELFSRPQKAADVIEEVIKKKRTMAD